MTPFEESPEVILHDGTKIVFPINLDESVSSDDSSGSLEYDSDGNEISISSHGNAIDYAAQ